jgi:hypothetical protein
MTEPPWVAGIRTFENEIPLDGDSVAAWRTGMRAWGFDFLNDGRIVQRMEPSFEVGRWILLAGSDRDAAVATLDRTWPGCPLVGPRVGCVALHLFEFMTTDDDRRELLCGLVKEGRDGLLHRPSGRSWSTLGLSRRALDTCLRKYSFDGGAELLTRADGAYASWVRDTVYSAAEKAGYHAVLGWSATSHNPLHLGRYATADGGWHPALFPLSWKPADGFLTDQDADSVLSAIWTDLWLYDLSVLGAADDEASWVPAS